MMNLEQALKPISGRMRTRRAAAWALTGLCAGAVSSLLLRAASFLWAFPSAPLWSAVALGVLPALLALAAWAWPISSMDAARQADALGLQARTQTALMLKDSDTPMAELQRKDTLRSLSGLNPKEAMPVKVPKAALAVLLACAALYGLSYLVANPQENALQARAAFQTKMEEQADLVDEGAAKLEAGDPQTPELRKILGDLARELRRSEEPRAALGAVDEAERRMEDMRKATAKDALDALNAAGLSDLARALEQGDEEAAGELLSRLGADGAANALSAAAQNAANQTAAQALSNAAQAMRNGSASQALAQLSAAATGQSGATVQAAALGNMARAAAARAGAQQAASLQMAGMGAALSSLAGSGAGGMNAASQAAGGPGAGTGSSDKDGGYTASAAQASGQGTRQPEKKTAEYEAIYDPTRLGGSGETVNERGRLGEGETSEATVGTGVGSIGESVPYNRVLPEYQDSAVQAVQNADLPAYVQKWVQTYFGLLAE